ncbi:hypothetical protein ACFX10_018846 [Malus domestica]
MVFFSVVEEKSSGDGVAELELMFVDQRRSLGATAGLQLFFFFFFFLRGCGGSVEKNCTAQSSGTSGRQWFLPNPSSSWLLSLGVMGRDKRAAGEGPREYQHRHRFFECHRQHLVVDLQLL